MELVHIPENRVLETISDVESPVIDGVVNLLRSIVEISFDFYPIDLKSPHQAWLLSAVVREIERVNHIPYLRWKVGEFEYLQLLV